jgi:hypothetical protein
MLAGTAGASGQSAAVDRGNCVERTLRTFYADDPTAAGFRLAAPPEGSIR